MEKVELISNIFPSKANPTRGTFVKKSFDFLNKRKEVKLITLTPSSSKLILALKYLKFYFQIIRANKEGSILFIHYANHPLIPFRFFTIKAKMIVNAHGGDILPQNTINSLLAKFTRPVLKRAELLIVPSLFLKSKVEQVIPEIDANRILISPSGGVDTSKFIPRKKEKSADFTVGFISRLVEGKGWRLFLNAFESLPVSKKRAVIIGTGPDYDKVQNYIDELSLTKKVELVGGVKHDELPEYYQEMDVFVFPTKFEESLGLVAIEALSCAIPVIASSLGAIPEYISDGHNGYLFKPGSDFQLSDKLKMFYNLSIDSKIQMSENARIEALKFDAEIVSQKYLNYVENYISN